MSSCLEFSQQCVHISTSPSIKSPIVIYSLGTGCVVSAPFEGGAVGHRLGVGTPAGGRGGRFASPLAVLVDVRAPGLFLAG